MSGFADLVLRAQPCLARVKASPSQGATWRWTIDGFNDAAGTPVDFTTGTVGVCKVIDDVLGSEILQLTFTGGVGSITVSADETATVDLVSQGESKLCRWFCHITKGGDKLYVWNSNSPFVIQAGE